MRPTRPAQPAQTFLAALREKYAPVSSAADSAAHPHAQVVISGKVAEEVGFEKIARKQAKLSELKYVILDGMRIAAAHAPDDEPVAGVCPSIVELDLSRNLFKRIDPVVAICSELPRLRSLRLK